MVDGGELGEQNTPSRNDTTAGSSGACTPYGSLVETPICGGESLPVGLVGCFRFLDFDVYKEGEK